MTTSADSAIGPILARLADAGVDELTDELIAAARRAGSRELMTQGRRQISGDQLALALACGPQALAARGMRAGDVALFAVRPGIDAIVALLATLRAGGCAMFVDPGAGDALFARRLELLEPRWVIAETALYVASARTPLRPFLRRRGLELPDLGRLRGRHVRIGPRLIGVPRSESLAAMITERADDAAALPAVDPDAPGLVIFTSGTTGAPKGVQHTGRSLVGALRLMLESFQLAPDAVLYDRNIHSCTCALLNGVPTVVAPLRFSVRRWLRDVERHHATHAFLLPVEAYRVAQECQRRGTLLPASLRQLFLYSAPITVAALEQIHERATPELAITCVYGMTEMAPVSWIDSREKVAWTGDGDVVGPPGPCIDARIDERDELHVRGPNQHLGYIGHEVSEWHATGDLARIDDDRNIVLLGRGKDMIIRGNFNLYPGLYEPTVARIPEVAQCAFVGIPDPVTADEQVVLFVEPRTDLRDSPDTIARRIERQLRDGGKFGIDRDALPDRVRVIAELPRSGRSSKVDRKLLRALAAAES